MSAAPAYHPDEGWRGYPIGVHFDFLNDSWKFFKATWRQWAAVVFILIVAYFIGNLPQWISDFQKTEAEQLESVLSGRGFGPLAFSILWTLIVTSPLYCGALLFGLDIVDGKAPELSRIFSPFKRLLPVAGASFLQQFMLGIGTAFCLIPGIYLLGRTYYWPILVADQKMGNGRLWLRVGSAGTVCLVLVCPRVGYRPFGCNRCLGTLNRRFCNHADGDPNPGLPIPSDVSRIRTEGGCSSAGVVSFADASGQREAARRDRRRGPECGRHSPPSLGCRTSSARISA